MGLQMHPLTILRRPAMPRRTVLVAALATLAPATTAHAAPAGSFGCSATAPGGTVLGQALTPGVAGGDGACRSDDAGGPVLGMRGVAATVLNGSGVATQTVASTAGADGLSIGALDALKGLLPVPALPAGLDQIPVTLPAGIALPAGVTLPSLPTAPTLPGVPVPPLPLTTPTSTTAPLTLPGTGTTTAVPTTVPIDVTPAVDALLAAAQRLPSADLLHLDAVRATAGALCQAGTPVLSGISRLVGASALGQALPSDGPVQQAIPVVNGSTLDLANLDLAKVVLPAGLSFDTPVVGPALAAGLRSALAALPPIQIPATVADVSITPGAQDRSDGSLVQHAPRVRISVLGQQLVDLDLGAARVSALGVDCGAAVAATAAPASQLAVQCAKRPVTLVDVAPAADHVALLGAAAAADVGKRVSIVFPATGKVVATTVVRPDGFFRAAAPLPSRAMRHSSRTRYVAVVEGHKSLALKLDRRMRISSLRHRGGKVRIVGKIAGPLAPGQEIVIRRSESCSKDVIVKRFVPARAGTWRITLPAPAGGQAAVYRASTEVLGADGTSGRTFPTFTLPGYVSL